MGHFLLALGAFAVLLRLRGHSVAGSFVLGSMLAATAMLLTEIA